MRKIPDIEITYSSVANLFTECERCLRGAWDKSRIDLPGVGWNFSELSAHLEDLANLIRNGNLLKAHRAHRDFTVGNPAVLLAKKRKRSLNEFQLRKWGALAGRVTSLKKETTSAKNFEKARETRWRKYMLNVYGVSDPNQFTPVRTAKAKKHQLMQRRERHGGRSMSEETKLRLAHREQQLVAKIKAEVVSLPEKARLLLLENVELEDFIRSRPDENKNSRPLMRAGKIRTADSQDRLLPGFSL